MLKHPANLSLRVLQFSQVQVGIDHLHRPGIIQISASIGDLGRLDQPGIDKWNAFLQTRVHKDEKQAGILSTIGREDNTDLSNAAILNMTEDFHYAYRQLLDNRS